MAETDRTPELDDTRDDGPMTGSEREVLEHYLEQYRDTVHLKIAGLTPDQLCRASVPPSTLTLLGIVRHLTEVEAYWVRDVVLGQDSPDIHSSRENPDGDLLGGTPATAFADLERYRREVRECRELLAGWGDLGVPVRGLRRGRDVSLRWVLVHLIEEYARHLGHMDLIREAIDGRTGF